METGCLGINRVRRVRVIEKTTGVYFRAKNAKPLRQLVELAFLASLRPLGEYNRRQIQAPAASAIRN